MIDRDITIMIPTLDRAPFVARALDYYASVKFRGRVIVGDSSGTEHATLNIESVAAVSDMLDVELVRCPVGAGETGLDRIGFSGEAICMMELLERIRTPYTAVAGDDDLQVPAGLVDCATFLERNPDFNAAHGLRLEFRTQGDLSRGEVMYVRRTRQPHLEQALATDRWRSYTRFSISPLYSVLRTDTWRDIYAHFPSVSMRYIGSEFLVSALSVIGGKVKEIDRLSTVHQYQEDRILNWRTVSFYSMMMHPKWTTSARNLRRIIADALAEADGIPPGEAEETFDREFWRHLSGGLSSHYRAKYGPEVEEGGGPDLITSAGRMARRVIKGIRSLFRTDDASGTAENLLDQVLNANHPLHSDFSPVHTVISAAPPTAS